MHRCIEVVEGLELDDVRDLRINATVRLVLFDEQGAVRFFDGTEYGLFVEWTDGAQVDDFDADAVLLLQGFSGLE